MSLVTPSIPLQVCLYAIPLRPAALITISSMSGAFVPCVMLIIGSNIAQRPSKAALPPAVVACVGFVRLFVIPTIGCSLVIAAHALGLLPPQDKVLPHVHASWVRFLHLHSYALGHHYRFSCIRLYSAAHYLLFSLLSFPFVDCAFRCTAWSFSYSKLPPLL